jgi:Tfp pilus assembly protein PilX
MNRFRRHCAPASRQRGVTLIIALIVLAALTLAGLAMMRSVDTATLMAGNIASKKSTQSGADQGLQTGYWWLSSNATGAILQTDNTGAGYLSSVPALEPDWMNNANWANAFALNNGARTRTATKSTTSSTACARSRTAHRVRPATAHINTCGTTRT